MVHIDDEKGPDYKGTAPEIVGEILTIINYFLEDMLKAAEENETAFYAGENEATFYAELFKVGIDDMMERKKIHNLPKEHAAKLKGLVKTSVAKRVQED